MEIKNNLKVSGMVTPAVLTAAQLTAIGTPEFGTGSLFFSADNNRFEYFDGTNFVPFVSGGALSVGTANESGFLDITNDVLTLNITDGGIDGVKITSGTINTLQLADGSVTTAKIADDAVTNAKMALLSVGTAELIDASVTSVKLADNSVGTLEIIDASVTPAKLTEAYYTEAEVDQLFSDLVGGAGPAYDTLLEIANELQSNDSDIATILTEIGNNDADIAALQAASHDALTLGTNVDSILSLTAQELSIASQTLTYDVPTSTISSSFGGSAAIPLATDTDAGLMSATDKARLAVNTITTSFVIADFVVDVENTRKYVFSPSDPAYADNVQSIQVKQGSNYVTAEVSHVTASTIIELRVNRYPDARFDGSIIVGLSNNEV